jgi:acetyltransferase-like isoleucine patch superfamily enzyme
MTDNMFFDKTDLKACGENVIIGKTVRIRYPELVSIGDNVIIDDFTYISTALEIGSYVHIAAGCKIIGGPNSSVVMCDFSTLAPNVVLSAGSDDYRSGIAGPFVPMRFKGNASIGCIEIGRHSIVGANSTVLPNVTFHDGAAVGAQSLVKNSLTSWTLNVGVPTRCIGNRNAEEILNYEKSFKEEL